LPGIRLFVSLFSFNKLKWILLALFTIFLSNIGEIFLVPAAVIVDVAVVAAVVLVLVENDNYNCVISLII
jgi:hypothetical protein